jgi:hypothetical protein
MTWNLTGHDNVEHRWSFGDSGITPNDRYAKLVGEPEKPGVNTL